MRNKKSILVTGDLGYIGSHSVVEIIQEFEKALNKEISLELAGRR